MLETTCNMVWKWNSSNLLYLPIALLPFHTFFHFEISLAILNSS